jgi:uncharacterized protein YjeT (DUF2065 family)
VVVYLMVISLVLIAQGSALILMPKRMIKLGGLFLRDKKTKMMSVFPLTLGILLLFASPLSGVPWLAVFLGLSGIAKGIYLFVTPLEKVKSHRWFKLSDNEHRAVGIFVLILGVILFISRV